MKRLVSSTLTAAAAIAMLALTVPAAQASPQPPTNGGNGAGMSGQCTGPQADRPHSCKSQGGPGDRP